MFVLKKNETFEEFNSQKIIDAVLKSADRVNAKLTKEELLNISNNVKEKCFNGIKVSQIHRLVESELEKQFPNIAKSYRDYRNYKEDFAKMFEDTLEFKTQIEYRGDRENANSDSAFVSTKRSLVYKKLNKELYKKFFLNKEELQAIKEGFIYIHDIGDRLDTFNCCLFDIGNVLKGGFELANMKYTEPKTIDAAFDVIADVALASAAQQYGGYTLAEIDTILVPYGQMSYTMYYKAIQKIYNEAGLQDDAAKFDHYAMENLRRDIQQGFQSWEYKFNTLASSRGDYPFITITMGLAADPIGQMINIEAFRVRAEGQGEKGKKRPVLFPKIVFLYDEELHGTNKPLENIFNEAIKCSGKAMYPDYLSLSGDGYVADIYKQYGLAISPMGK